MPLFFPTPAMPVSFGETMMIAASADDQHTNHLHSESNGNGASAEETRVLVHDARIPLPELHNSGEDSGTSDGSAAYFSGDSDLTAEQPLVGGSCLADDNEPQEADRRTNSGGGGGSSSSSSNPVLPKLKGSGNMAVGTDQIIPSPMQKVESEHRTMGELKVGCGRELASMADLVGLAPSISMACASRPPSRLIGRQDQSALIDSPDQRLMRESLDQSKQRNNMRSSFKERGNILTALLPDSETRSPRDSWLELRLSLSGHGASEGDEMDCSADKARWSVETEFSDGLATVEAERVTLQLLPEERPQNLRFETASTSPLCSQQLRSAAPADYAASGRSIHSYAPCPSLTLSAPTSLLDNDLSSFHSQLNTGNAAAGASVPHTCSEYPASLHGRARDRLTPPCGSENLHEVMQLASQGNQHRSLQHSPFLGNYGSPFNLYMQNSTNAERRSIWLASSEAWTETTGAGSGQAILIDESGAQTAGQQQRPSADICRPTASFGWPAHGSTAGAADKIRAHWSGAQIYGNAQGPGGMSWQGLLRSMANEPQVLSTQCPIPDHLSAPRFGIDPKAPPDSNDIHPAIWQSTPAMRLRRRHMTTATLPPSASETLPSKQKPPAVCPPTSRLPNGRRRLRLALASRRRRSDYWFSLQEEDAADEYHASTSKHEQDHLSRPSSNSSCAQKTYLRIRDGRMQISVVKRYIVKKLGSADMHHNYPEEVDIKCRGKLLSPTLTIQHIHDKIWLNKEMDLQDVGFKHNTNQIHASKNSVIALWYQRHYTTQNLTLNVLNF